MSGIVGMLHLDGRPASLEAIAGMSRAIAHRGEASVVAHCEGGVALAQRRAHAPAPERAAAPSVGRRIHVVADARIDNRAELAGALGDASSAGDEELITAAYLRWGDRCADRLAGDFAFALWDADRRRLFCARDAMGVRPLYYYASDRLFACASEAKALLILGEVSRELDVEQLALFVEGDVRDRDRTIFRAIHRLPAGHVLTRDDAGLRCARYWHLDAERELGLSGDDDYAESFRALFEEAVRARLSGGPIGAALSGGLDSSSVVCTARALTQHMSGAATPLRTFSLIFPSLSDQDRALIDERRYIASVVREGGVRSAAVRGDLLSPVDGIDALLAANDEPYLAPNLYLHRAMYEAAAASGTPVFLDGFDGDTAVSHGFGRLHALANARRWNELDRELRATALNREVPVSALLEHFGRPLLHVLARRGAWGRWLADARELRRRYRLSFRDLLVRDGLAPAMPALARAVRRAGSRRDSGPVSLLHPALARPLRQRRQDAASDPELDATRSERAAHAAALANPAYQLTLELADKCAASVGVEPRYPFFDRRLIEFCLALPDDQKLDGGWSRLVLRRAMDGVLPAAVQWRRDKGNLSPNFHGALRASPAIRFDADALDALAPYVRVDALRAAAEVYRRERRTLARAEDGHAIFRAVVLSRWLVQRAHLDAVPRASPAVVAA